MTRIRNLGLACAGLAAGAAFMLALPVPARAQLKNENLLVTMPKGFKVGYRARKDNRAITEMVPDGETVEDWSEMLTVQIFFGLRNGTPLAFRIRVENGWKQACPGGAAQAVSDKPENGYPALMWKLTCARNPQTGKPENTWFKAIAGADSFYVIQKAFRSEPTPAQAAAAAALLDKVSVCDTRRADRACPRGMQ